MPGGELVFKHKCLQFLRKTEQANRICNGGAGFSETLCNFILRQVMFIHKCSNGCGLFKCVQIFTLKIFNQRYFQNLLFVHFADNHGNFIQSCTACGTETAFTCND